MVGNFIFHFIYGMSSFPLTNSYFSRWLLHHQPVRVFFWYLVLGCQLWAFCWCCWWIWITSKILTGAHPPRLIFNIAVLAQSKLFLSPFFRRRNPHVGINCVYFSHENHHAFLLVQFPNYSLLARNTSYKYEVTPHKNGMSNPIEILYPLVI